MLGVVALMGHAAAAAKRLGAEAVSDVEVLLGALEHDTGAARRAIDGLGVATEHLFDAARHDAGERSGAVENGPLVFSPRADQVLHRACGYALAHGRTHPTAADVLVAVLWHDPASSSVRVLERCGLTADRVAAALRDQGVRVPDLPLPRWVEVDFGPCVTVPVGFVDEVMGLLTAELGDRYEWGFNIEGEALWVQGEEAADIPRRVTDLVGHEVAQVDGSRAGPVRIDADRRRGQDDSVARVE